MTVKEFLGFLDLNKDDTVLIIPVCEKTNNGGLQSAESCTVDKEKKVRISTDEYGLTDVEKYEAFCIKPTLKSGPNKYKEVRLRYSDDGYAYIQNDMGSIWVLV